MKADNYFLVWSSGSKTNRMVKVANYLRDILPSSSVIKFVYLQRGENDTEQTIESLRPNIVTQPIFQKSDKFGAGINGILSRLMWMLKVFFHLIRCQPKFVYCVDFDSIIPCVAYRIIFHQTHLVYDVADFIYTFDNNFPSWMRKLFRRVDYIAMSFTHAIILADENRVPFIPDRYHKKVKIIENMPAKADVINCDFGVTAVFQDDLPIVLYYGSLVEERGLRDLQVLIDSNEVNVLVAGWGRDADTFSKRNNEKENFRFLGSVSTTEILSHLNYVDLSMISYDPSFEHNRLASPNKLFEALVFGVPVLVAKGTSIDRYVEQQKVGYTYDYGDAYWLKNKLVKSLSIMKRRSRCCNIEDVNHRFLIEATLDKELKSVFISEHSK